MLLAILEVELFMHSFTMACCGEVKIKNRASKCKECLMCEKHCRRSERGKNIVVSGFYCCRSVVTCSDPVCLVAFPILRRMLWPQHPLRHSGLTRAPQALRQELEYGPTP